ncbi:MAG: Uma2 family endonuclease [Deltaproteobacteria bacterium]|nr:Uma2 family endonuclease [Deltaproteobacteria bacterium]
MTQPARKPSDAVALLFSIPEHKRNHEVLDGVLVERASPGSDHGFAQAKTVEACVPFNRRSGGDPPNPGGWWIMTEVEILLGASSIARPDLSGWRRERAPTRPQDNPIELRPDWVCEIISPSTAARDRVAKLRLYQEQGIPHYWIVDPSDRTLTVFRNTDQGYLVVLAAESEDKVRAEPFDAVELAVGDLFENE